MSFRAVGIIFEFGLFAERAGATAAAAGNSVQLFFGEKLGFNVIRHFMYSLYYDFLSGSLE
jgi:hypothetical protein